MKRFGVSLEDDLLRELDGLVAKHQFPNRSQAIRYLIRQHVIKDQWEANQDVCGCVVLVYDHHKRDLLAKSTDVQHQYHHLILSSQHVHLDHQHCLETITLKGKARQLRVLADHLIAIKGIKYGDLVMSATQ
jgi:CopG family nickel-responsive transcriptional regulator